MILGAVLAGGRSSRFGSDKAVATVGGKALIDHVAEALAVQCDAVVIVGRPGGIPDRPQPGEGPLGGLAGALHHAGAEGFEAVLTAACDNLDLPPDCAIRLSPGPSHAEGQQSIGLWPATLAPMLDAWLAEQPDRSIIGWARHVGARAVRLSAKAANINSPADLAEWERRHGL